MKSYRFLNSDINGAKLRTLNLTQINILSAEIRSFLIDSVSKTGGHLASNLGVVELTLAMHNIFDLDKDDIVFDVGHQCYVHKILTGRLDKFDTLRSLKGISGFPKPSESRYDSYISGHSSTSISVATGIAKAKRLARDKSFTIAVIGDGALTGGLAFEGLINATKDKDKLIVILNDNEMSISKNVGPFGKYLSKIRTNDSYFKARDRVEKAIEGLPVIGKSTKSAATKIKTAIKNTLYSSNFFEDFGFHYMGPVDGHNFKAVCSVLKRAKQMDKPAFVHIKTTKGKGYYPSEQNPGAFHGVSPNMNHIYPEISNEDSFSTIFGKELVSIEIERRNLVAITAAMKYGTGLQYFKKQFPHKFFDVGIAEQHAVVFAGGLASDDLVPVFAVYSTFLQRAYDQLIHDIAIAGKHIVLGVDRAGIVGEDGETHQGIFDVSFLTSVPNTTIYSPHNYTQLKHSLREAVSGEGLVAVRYPRGCEDSSIKDICTENDYIEVGSGKKAVVTYGRLFANALKAAEESEEKIAVINLVKIFPIENDLIKKLLKFDEIYFIEEGFNEGGIGEKIACKLLLSGYKGKFLYKGVEGFVPQAMVPESLTLLGLDTQGISDFLRSGGKGER